MRTIHPRAIWLVGILAASAPGAGTGPPAFCPPPSDRIKINIDQNWGFLARDFPAEEETHQVNQLPWQTVDLPHEWSIEGPYCETHNTTQGFLPMGIGWYQKALHLPNSYAGKQLYLLFDGVYRASDVWMNYVHLGHHESGYTSFLHDITDYVRTGDVIPNGLRVRVDGRRHEQDMYEGSGIYRHVWLLVTNKLHVENWGTFVTTPSVSAEAAVIKVQTTIKNEHGAGKNCRLITKIVDAAGTVVAEASAAHPIGPHRTHEFTQVSQVAQPHLWNLDDPYLYRAHSIVMDDDVVVDTEATTFGIRTFAFDPNRGFFLNGAPVKLRGFNGHHDFAGLGTAIPDRIHWNAMMAMKQAGFNFYRSCHHPATPERLDVCDQIGMLVWDEIERKLESVETELPLVKETIVRDRNHPSVILWSLENESPLESTVYGTRILTAATKLAHQLDPTRLTTFAASMPVNKNGYGDAVDVVSYNYHWQRADQDHIDFPHWRIGLLSEYSAARARRGVYGVQHFDRAQNDSYFNLYSGMVQTIYEMCSRIEQYWRRIEARDYLGGGCLWSGIDYWGEGNAWPLVARGDGALDLCLFPKDPYYYFVSRWTTQPMVHVLPHWNWPGHDGKPIDVWCYTNCDCVELLLNGRALGTQARPQPPTCWTPQTRDDTQSATQPDHLAWQVPYEPGELRAVGMRGGQVVCSQVVRTAGAAAKIELSRVMSQFVDERNIPPLVADGRDVVVIKAAILDADGQLVPTADQQVTFEVAGDPATAGTIVGVGNGDIASHESNKVPCRRAYNGLCAVVVRSADRAGEFVVSAAAPGLESGRMAVSSVPPTAVAVLVDAKPAQITATESATIRGQICDRFRCVIPTAEQPITFELSGPAVFANGAKSTTAVAAGGRAEVAIQGQNTAGEITVTARSEGLIPHRVVVPARSRPAANSAPPTAQ